LEAGKQRHEGTGAVGAYLLDVDVGDLIPRR